MSHEDRIRKLEAEIAQLNERLADTPDADDERRVQLMGTIREVGKELGRLRYEQMTPAEREKHWLWATNHQMRVQCEVGIDEYAIFSSEWLEEVRAWEPAIEHIMLRVAEELKLDYDLIMRLATAKAGSDEWEAIREEKQET